MAWALDYQRTYTVNDSDVLNPIPVGGYLEYEGIRGNDTGSLQIFIDTYTDNADIIAFGSSGQLRIRINGNLQDSSGTVAAGEAFTMRIERGATEYRTYLNGSLELTHLKSVDLGYIRGFCRSNFQCRVQLKTCTLNDGTLDFEKWDATASNHGAGIPYLVNTITGNGSTSQNMPTDGSVWIDLGGGTSPPWWVFQEDIIIY